MKLSFMTYLFKRWPLEKAFMVAAEQGFDGVEIWAARPHAYPKDLDQAHIENIIYMKQKYKLEIPMITPEVLGYPYNLASQDEKERKETVEYLKSCIDAASKIDSPRVQVAVGHPGYNTSRRKNKENVVACISELAEYAEKKTVDLVVKPLTLMESSIYTFLDDIVELIEEIGSKHIKGMLDMVPPFVHHEALSDYFEKLGDRMDYIHFMDSDGKNEYHYQIGEGNIPLAEAVKIFRKYNYDGWLSIELLMPQMKDPELYSDQGITRIKELLGK